MMSDNIFVQDTPVQPSDQLQTATLGSYTSGSGWTLILDGQTTPTQKHYKRLSSAGSLASGNRVVIAKLSGTYVILGSIAT